MKPLRIAALSTIAGLFTGLALACAGFGSGSSDLGSYRYESPSSPTADGYATLDQAYRVPPDRASVSVQVDVTAPSPVAAAAGVDEQVAEVRAKVASGGTGCTTTVLDYETPRPSGDDAAAAGAEVRVDVDLKGLADTEARRARVDACLVPLEPILTRGQWKSFASVSHQIQRSPPVLLVDAPEAHRDALLAREQARLAWAAAARGAPQLHPEDLRCVPDGRVRVVGARLSGVALELGMECRVEGPEAGDEGESD